VRDTDRRRERGRNTHKDGREVGRHGAGGLIG